MIWNSPVLMTAIDVVVIVIALATLYFIRRAQAFAGGSPGSWLIAAGIGVMGLFYLADLLLMHVAPMFVGISLATKLMEQLHLEVSWIVAPIALALVFCGFAIMVRLQEVASAWVKMMTDSLPVGVAYLDRDRRLRYLNADFEHLCRTSSERALHRTVDALLDADVFARYSVHEVKALNGERVTFDVVARYEGYDVARDLQFELIPHRSTERVVIGLFILVRDITQQVELEREVVNAADEERLVIARDLHDGLGQTLTGALLAHGALINRLEREQSAQLEFARQLAGTLEDAIMQTRHLTYTLAPGIEGGLARALTLLAERVTLLHRVRCLARDVDSLIAPDHESTMHLYRIAQESVNNACRHGQPTEIELRLSGDQTSGVLEVVDNGRGIEESELSRPGFGLRSMRYRARMLGGAVEVAQCEGGGTRVQCSFPLRETGALAASA